MQPQRLLISIDALARYVLGKPIGVEARTAGRTWKPMFLGRIDTGKTSTTAMGIWNSKEIRLLLGI